MHIFDYLLYYTSYPIAMIYKAILWSIDHYFIAGIIVIGTLVVIKLILEKLDK